MKENSIRKAVREGRAALGTGIKEFATRGVPWIVESSGFDYAMIDMEHGAFDLETIANLAGWFEATNVSPIVRIHKAFVQMIPTLLDQGIKGIQISEVETVEEACAIAQLANIRPSAIAVFRKWARTPTTGATVHVMPRNMRRGPMRTPSFARPLNHWKGWRTLKRLPQWMEST